jgi:predicted acylesterase/phospholipase RssA/MinD-like ATPase involved in chromosome partitioning or flagellar assembly
MLETKKGTIITFYSYKGGTGRSMALANVAWILASNGKKVLTIDWDLEAPGLHRYFYPFLVDKDLTSSEGLIDFVNNFAIEAATPIKDAEETTENVSEQAVGNGQGSDEDWYKPLANILRYAMSLDWEFPSGGTLDFIPAGRQGASYGTRVNSFNWQNFYDNLGGGRFLEEAKRIMRAEYDYILIDSRTGVSDTSGVCTVQMPDTLVACFTLNNQGIAGALAVANSVFEQVKASAQPATQKARRKQSALPDQKQKELELREKESEERRSRFNIFPVPMRLENNEKEKLERRMVHARSAFSQFPLYQTSSSSDYWKDVCVDYIPYYAYEEILAAFGDREQVILLSAAERLTFHLTGGEISKLQPPSEEDRLRVIAEYTGQNVKIDPVEELDRVAENAFGRLSPDQQIIAQRAILCLLRVAGSSDVSGDVRQRLQLNQFDEITKPVLFTLRDSRLLSIEESSPDSGTVEIAGDGFLQKWVRLRGWIEEDRDFLLWRQQLRPYVDEWKRNRNNDAPLVRDARLETARSKLINRAADLQPDEREYIQASVQLKVLQDEQAGHTRTQEQHDTLRVSKPKPRGTSENVNTARNVLRGLSMEPLAMFQLAKRLKEEREFGLARRLLARARIEPGLASDPKLRLQVFQQSALCTYKDPDLPADARLDRALEILSQSSEDINTTTDQETLGLTGSIYKRKWEVDNQKEQLERSLNYYLRGHLQGPANDQGYNGINAAYVLDLLAHQEEEEAKKAKVSSEIAAQRRDEARQIRMEIIRQVSPLEKQDWLQGKWWFYSTIAEAHFGIGDYNEAIKWLQHGCDEAEARQTSVAAWEYESTARQLATLARLQPETEKALAALAQFFGSEEIQSAFEGKVGLGLSGGGFRAALFHIGVLARLAELDVLRRVEVLSCVSGGSIIGAHYYLEVRKLLQTKPDAEITRQDYIDIVARLRKHHLDGVQKNIRMRVLANPFINLKMFFTSKYSRTMRAGDLYESEIFSRVKDGAEDDDRWLNGLYVCPIGKDDQPDENFNFKSDNWRRRAKVPNLILNTTALNTGHNWQFTASWMGEPPASIDEQIDGNDRLRRLYYNAEDTPKHYRKVRLGHAVAASACVPGLFEPLPLGELYPERTVRLVDGGVCDNQGVGSLLEQDCNVILVSDGSGQMGSENQPSNGLLGVPLRSNSILQARVREAQYRELSARKRASLLRGFMFVHLKDDLDVDPIDWIGCLDPFDASDDSRPTYRRGPFTRYGIAKNIQTLLAGVRTDLDSFSDVEAFALMTSAYRMTEHEFKYSKCISGFPEPKQSHNWDFLAVEDGMKGGGTKYDYLKRQLDVSGHLAFKIWKLSTPLRVLSLLLAIVAVAVAFWASFRWSGLTLLYLTVGRLRALILLMIAGFIGTYVLGKTAMRVVRWRDTVTLVALGLLSSVLGWFVANLHLLFFDRWFLRQGSLDRFNDQ